MWFVGLIVGAVLGALISIAHGIGFGAVVGAMAGLFVALLFQKRTPSVDAQWQRDVEEALRELNRRLKAVESGGRAEAPIESAAAAPAPSAPIEPAPAVAPVPIPEEMAPAASGEPSERAPEPVVPSASQLPPQPAPPSRLWSFLFGGNTLVRSGIIVLFFGVAFLLKYAAEHARIPIEVRLSGVALGAIALLAIGWKLRLKRSGYALIMQGGGIGVLYLTVFAAFRIWQLLPPGIVLGLLVAMAVFSAMLAVLQDSRSLAAMGVTGGFLAPVLAATGGGSHVMLFSFYALLNLGILCIAWYKAWRVLNLLGFAFTFVIGLLWGSRYYRPDLFATTEPFLVLHFVFYVAIAVLFAIRQAASIRNRVDGTLVFGTPLIAFGLQLALVRNIEYGAAFSALAVSAFYLVLAKALYRQSGEPLRLLVEAFLALGVAFATLAIPLALDGRWTSAVWALEGAAIVWVAVRQARRLACAFGVLLQFGAGIAFLLDSHGMRGVPVLNSAYLGAAFVSTAGLFCAWYLGRRPPLLGKAQRTVGVALFVWGTLWWFAGGIAEFDRQLAWRYETHAALAFFAASCAGFSLLSRRLVWRAAKYPALALLPLIAIVGLIDLADAPHPFARFGYLAWPLAFAGHYWILHRHEADTRYMDGWHGAALWLVSWLGGWEVGWQIGRAVEGEAWQLIAWALVPGGILGILITRGDRIRWPVASRPRAYFVIGALPLAVFLWWWAISINFASNGAADPLPYVPLVNPLDLAQAAALIALWSWLTRMRQAQVAPGFLRVPALRYAATGSAAFVVLNGVLLRTLHHWASVPFDFDAMMRSMLVQAAFSIFWTVLAVCAMLLATRYALRALWIAGAALMTIVVAKLFFIDLSNVGGVERIVSFIGVGVLMLVIGYFSPVPPKTAVEAK